MYHGNVIDDGSRVQPNQDERAWPAMRSDLHCLCQQFIAFIRHMGLLLLARERPAEHGLSLPAQVAAEDLTSAGGGKATINDPRHSHVAYEVTRSSNNKNNIV